MYMIIDLQGHLVHILPSILEILNMIYEFLKKFVKKLASILSPLKTELQNFLDPTFKKTLVLFGY